MGLLSKASSFGGKMNNQEEKAKKAEGLLAKATLYSESHAPTGLLEKAKKREVSEESDVEEAEKSGLLQKAQALSEEKKEGLLEKAEIIAKRKEGLLESVEVVEEAGTKEGLLERARRAIEKEAEQAKVPSKPKAPRGGRASVKRKKEVLEAEPKEQVAKQKPPDMLARQYLKEEDVIALVGLLSRTARESGHEALLQLVLKTATDLCKAKSGVCLSLRGRKYKSEEVVSSEKQKKSLERLSYPEGSKLVRLLKKRWGESLKTDDVKEELSKRDLKLLGPLMPCVVFPLIGGMRLSGFIIIGNIPKKERIEQKSLLLLSHIFASFVNDYALSEELLSKEKELSQQKEESEGFLALYDYFEAGRYKIRDALDRLSALFHIETAVLVTGWDEKGGLEVNSGIGVTEEEIRRFRFSKKDRELAAILKKGEPKVPKDMAKRISSLSEELEREFKTYVAIPVCFHGICLAIFLILDMKGVGKKLPKQMRLKLKAISSFFVPYLLYNRLLNTDPYLSFEFILEQEIKESAGAEHPLHIVVCTLKGIEKGMKDEEFTHYRKLYDRLYRVCREIIAGSGRVSMVSWKRVVLMIRDVQPEKVDAIINHIRERFTQILKTYFKQDKQKLGLTFKKVSYQRDRISFYELLSAVY